SHIVLRTSLQASDQHSTLFFFFQAEDGIRDGHVTGVQTCALPICPVTTPLDTTRRMTDERWLRMIAVHLHGTFYCSRSALDLMRSEERRVGKEGRCWGGAE